MGQPHRFANRQEREDAIALSTQIQEHGDEPRGPVTATDSIPRGARAADPDAYDPDADLNCTETGARKFRMPSGGIVWVHPLSPEEVIWLNGQADRHLTRLRLAETDPARRVAFRVLCWVYQSIACCRRGPEPGAPHVWELKNAEALYRNPRPGHETLQRIVLLCDEIGRGGAGSILTEELVGFFGATATWLRTCCSRLTTDGPENWLPALEGFASYVARIALQGTFAPSDLAELPPLPSPPSPPAP